MLLRGAPIAYAYVFVYKSYNRALEKVTRRILDPHTNHPFDLLLCKEFFSVFLFQIMSQASAAKDEVPGQWLVIFSSDIYEICLGWTGRLYQRYMQSKKQDCAPIAEALHNCMFWLQRKDVQELVSRSACN